MRNLRESWGRSMLLLVPFITLVVTSPGLAEQKAGMGANGVADTQSESSSGDGEAQGGLAMVKRSVGEVIARGSNLESRGTGVLVETDRGVVTNLHVVAATREIAFVPEVRATPIAMVAKRAWPDLDLVYLEPKDHPDALKAAGMTPIQIAPSTVSEGTEVFSVGYPRRLGYSVTRGIVSGVRTFKDLPDEYRRGWSRRADSRWVQTDCPINPGNSGGPLVTKSGHLVGINSWGSSVDDGIYFALLASEVVQAISSKEGGVHVADSVPDTGTSQTDATKAVDASAITLETAASATVRQVPVPGPRLPSSGYLQLRATEGCELLVDGVKLCDVEAGSSTMVISNLPREQEFVLELRRSGFGSTWRILKIPDTGVLDAQIVIGDPVPTELSIATVPTDCVVVIDGPVSSTIVKQGQTQVLSDLPPGEYGIRAERDGRVVDAKVVLAAAEPVVVAVNLIDAEVDVRKSGGMVKARMKGLLGDAFLNTGVLEVQRNGSNDWSMKYSDPRLRSSEWQRRVCLFVRSKKAELEADPSRVTCIGSLRVVLVRRGVVWKTAVSVPPGQKSDSAVLAGLAARLADSTYETTGLAWSFLTEILGHFDSESYGPDLWYPLKQTDKPSPTMCVIDIEFSR